MARSSLIAAALMVALLPAAASAAERDAGPYISVGGGYTLQPDPEITDSTLPGVTGEIGMKDGFGITGAVGYRFQSGFRAEGEISYRQNDIESISISGFGLTASSAASGDVTSAAGMVNAFYDFESSGWVRPYVGAGIGMAQISIDISVPGASASDDDTVFAYQGMIGVLFDISKSAAVNVGYRYFATTDPEFGTTESEYMTHNFEVGFTFRF